MTSSLGGATPDLTMVFVSLHHRAAFDELAHRLVETLGTRYLLGCTGETIIGGSHEFESSPAISLWSAVLPGADFEPFQIHFETTPDGVVCDGLPDDLSHDLDRIRCVLVLGEPFSSIPRSLLNAFNDELPGVPIVGGMASGGGTSDNHLFLGRDPIRTGTIGIVLRGGPRVRTLVSQGCRPIAEPFVVTRVERNIVFELGGVPPLRRLEALFPSLPPRDQRLIENGLQLGIAMTEYRDQFRPGDFLVSGVLGLDRDTGAMAVGNLVRVGQTVQFHVRDAAAADEDLTQLLTHYQQEPTAAPRGVLLFSCNGRGTRLFPEPDHDARAVQERLGDLPQAGFFAQGEFGPVGRQSYIHGFSASLAIFEEDSPAPTGAHTPPPA